MGLLQCIFYQCCLPTSKGNQREIPAELASYGILAEHRGFLVGLGDVQQLSQTGVSFPPGLFMECKEQDTTPPPPLRFLHLRKIHDHEEWMISSEINLVKPEEEKEKGKRDINCLIPNAVVERAALVDLFFLLQTEDPFIRE
ncbi:hypothetical protein TNCT_92451 [Trichonephila clavata]|uniref:Uncharacterized protein n=1 Tax=Trichonephila clavata TaxID=2740835 RepID=A0A8X6LKS6_TRICU|nr:hypothetical protein TNCT_92451 [Trichonephila clavata]